MPQEDLMKLLITMNMPARAGALVHQVYAEYDCDTLQDFMNVLMENEFLIVEELYRDREIATKFTPVGQVVLNYRYIGKVKELYANGKPIAA